MDPSRASSHQRRASASSQKLGPVISPYKSMVEEMQVDKKQSPCRPVNGSKNRLRELYHGLTTSKELAKVMSRLCRLEHEDDNSTSLSIVSALQFELDRACVLVGKLVKQQSEEQGKVDLRLRQLEEDKVVWKLKEQDRIALIAGEFEREKKLRRQTERLNKKLGRELAEAKASLSVSSKELEDEKRAREVLEKVCEELAQGIGEDRAAVAEEIQKQSAKVREEIEKEREMLQLADLLREERVQMKLAEAKYQFEEKNAVLDKLRDELEAYLKSKRREIPDNNSPRFDKIKELEEYLRKTLPESHLLQSNDQENMAETNSEEGGNSDLHSAKVNGEDSSKRFSYNDKKSIYSNSRTPSICSETKCTIEWGFSTKKPEDSEAPDERGLFEFQSQTWKKGVEDELRRYNIIRDLRDHIVSSSRMVASQDLSTSSKDHSEVVCQG